MTKYFQKKWKIQIGDIDVTELDCSFAVTRHLRGEPNDCTLKVWNLSRQNIASLLREEEIFVSINAGYAQDEEPTLIFKGSTKNKINVTVESGKDIVTTITLKDGRKIKNQTIRKAYDKRTSLQKVLNDLADEMGVGRGNISDFSGTALEDSNVKNFPEGFVAAGKAWEQFDGVVRSMGLRWSVQNGSILLLQQGTSATRNANLIDETTGLLGSPSKDKDGKVTCQVLIQPGVEPGKIIKLESKFIEGTYEIQETRYDGETFGGQTTPWFATLVLKGVK